MLPQWLRERAFYMAGVTHAELLQGWGQKERGLTRGAVMAFPAWELIRIMPRSVPRDWLARFTLSGGVMRNGRMIAMKDSAVWAGKPSASARPRNSA